MATETAALPPYRQFLPAAPLRAHVLCFWCVHAPPLALGPRRIRVLPDGCMDVIFNFGDRMAPEGSSVGQPEAFVVGASMRPGVVEMNGRTDIVGFRLRPGSAFPLLGTPCSELSDAVGPVEMLGAGLATLLRAHASSQPDPARRVRVMERLLLERLSLLAEPDPLVRQALHHLGREAALDKGIVPSDSPAEALGVGRRRLERLFARHVGVGPAAFRRTLRLHRALTLLRRPGNPLADAAHAAGFCDQPHMNREIKTLTGLSPLALQQEWRDVAIVQYEAAPF
ncbi:AraC family transcriptional regulator [Paucidesulfovibrio longus]|uniref:AraC family transcriptional regulator n=1 Tax=Paucidesulfovibrio longus TaxID=889 RepID=UPI0003B48BBC|nr:helix-turn-helix domain-containing protein [Paucidesulfovibrio longus]